MKTNNQLTIKVTRADIIKGSKVFNFEGSIKTVENRVSCYCPVALATRRLLGNKKRVRVTQKSIKIGSGKQLKTYLLNDRSILWIHSFDIIYSTKDFKNIKPTTIIANLLE